MAPNRLQLLAQRHRGHVLLWMMVSMTAFCGIVSFAVDYGHVQEVRTELQRTADATARGALAIYIQYGQSTAVAFQGAIVSNNPVDSASGISPTTSITWGWWDSVGKTFYTGSQGVGSFKAVKVTATRTFANSNGVPLTFGKLIGFKTCDVSTSAVAALLPQSNTNITIDSRGDPWLAGMPATSSSTASYDDNGAQTNGIPTAISVTPGAYLTFTGPAGSGNITGGVDHGDGSQGDNADGQTSNIYTHMMDSPDGDHNGVQNGIGNICVPIDGLIGVFLDNNRPDTTAAPSTVRDYSTQAARDLQSSTDLQLKQPFFVGQGQTSGGTTKSFRVPAGATRLYLGIMDGYEWNNNHGSFSAQMQMSQQILMVQ